jgi:hypothetical protein
VLTRGDCSLSLSLNCSENNTKIARGLDWKLEHQILASERWSRCESDCAQNYQTVELRVNRFDSHVVDLESL